MKPGTTTRKLVPLSGRIFGRWTVIRRAANSAGKNTRWLCQCECGTQRVVEAQSLANGHSRSCGCIQRIHGQGGLEKTRTYYSWHSMICRCRYPKNRDYKRYGERGIKVCDRWLKFENFFADMGERPDGTTLDRKNNDGNYEPGNCQWATPKEQAQNRRRKT